MFRDERYIRNDLEVRIPAYSNYGKYILDQIRKQPREKVALINGKEDSKLTYGELAQYAVDFAVSLMELGIKTGDVIAICLENSNEYVAIIIGIMLTGATYAALDLNADSASHRYKLNLSKPKIVIYCQSFRKKHEDVIANYDCKNYISTDDLNIESVIPITTLTARNCKVEHFHPAKVQITKDVAMILFSSGSTGNPKGVMISHYACLYSCSIDDFQDPDMNTSTCAGEWWCRYEIQMLFKFLTAGKTVTYFGNETDTLFKCIQDYKVNIAFLHGSKFSDIVSYKYLKQYNMDSLQFVYSGATPFHYDIKRKIMKCLPNLKILVDGYGMTETFEITAERWGVPGLKPTSVGKAAPGITLKVVDISTEKILGPHQRGEIRVEAQSAFKGYIGIDSSTYFDEEGFFKTGDIGYYDEDGYFYLVGRINEMINFNGQKSAPEEIEKILLQHPGVRDAGVVGKPVPDYIELPTAFIVKEPGQTITEKELIDFVAQNAGDHLRLRGGVQFVAEIPKSSTGKIKRFELKKMVNADVQKSLANLKTINVKKSQ